MIEPRAAVDPTQTGKGNWEGFDVSLERVYSAANEWRQSLLGITRPWLCWNVSNRWCALQQQLIKSVGWTPIVGFDPRIGPPQTVLPGTIVIDFNKHFDLPIMWPHFPLEFAFLYADRIGFWHSDLLCRLNVMQDLREIFEALPDGASAAVPDFGGRRNWLNIKRHRYWELAGCTTNAASRSQFELGTGWWRHIASHPNVPNERERARRRTLYYDHGVGIMYWKRRYKGNVVHIPQGLVEEGHCTSINKKSYKWMVPGGQRNMTAEIDRNYDLDQVASQLGIAHLL